MVTGRARKFRSMFSLQPLAAVVVMVVVRVMVVVMVVRVVVMMVED